MTLENTSDSGDRGMGGAIIGEILQWCSATFPSISDNNTLVSLIKNLGSARAGAVFCRTRFQVAIDDALCRSRKDIFFAGSFGRIFGDLVHTDNSIFGGAVNLTS
jgi:hypothetical protein